MFDLHKTPIGIYEKALPLSLIHILSCPASTADAPD